MRIFLGVLFFTLTLLAIGLLMPSKPPQKVDGLHYTPWAITHHADTTEVFGIQLGKTTLTEAEQQFKLHAETTLFLSEAGTLAVEAYFERVWLGGLKASMVLEIQPTPEQVTAILDAGTRVSTQGDGSRKISVDYAGQQTILHSPIVSITYLPNADLDETILLKRFGEPDEKISLESGKTHWIYRQKGLDILLNEDAQEVFQYVAPNDLERLTAPLRDAS